MATVFKTEADLCRTFRTAAERSGWRVHAEANGFDLYCVDSEGLHIGIEAKLRLNFKVLSQAVPHLYQNCGPDFRAVLVPTDPGVDDLLRCLGLYLYSGERCQSDRAKLSTPPEMLRWWPEVRPDEPRYESDAVAGSPCPVKLTHWKEQALRLIARLEVRGFVTKTDFKECGIDHRLWTNCRNGWLVKREEGGRFGRGGKLRFDADHPTAYAAILEETRKMLASG